MRLPFYLEASLLICFVAVAQCSVEIQPRSPISVKDDQIAAEADFLLGELIKKECNSESKEMCDIGCQQGKIHYQDGCCRCMCKKNYALFNRTVCVKATWTTWSKWSGCMESDWGGLQTRERVCKAGGVVSAGSCNGRGSMSRTCTKIKKDFRIRKNIRDLTDFETHDLIQAMKKFKKDTSKYGYRNIVSWHGWPGRCPWYHNVHKDNHCSWHHHPLFLPWHRLITIQLEDGLSRHMHNKTMGIPFWDWTEHWNDIPLLFRNPQIYDPILKVYTDNPFHSTYIRTLNGLRLHNQRHPWYPGLLMDNYHLKGAVRSLLSHNHYIFSEQLSWNPHDQIHDCFCWSYDRLDGVPQCTYSMHTVTYAAFDPVFPFHHSAIDRLFVMRRELEEEFGVSDWTSSRVAGQFVEGLEKSSSEVGNYVRDAFFLPISPFCNKSMNPDKLTNADGRWTTHKSYYNTQLFGYKYTDYNLGYGYNWEDLKGDFERIVVDGTFWNDEIFYTKIGPLYKKNSQGLKMVMSCAMKYLNPSWNATVTWN